MLVGFFTQLEFFASLVNGVFLLTVHQRASKEFYYIMATNTHLFLLLIQSIFKKHENVKTVLKYWNMTCITGKLLVILKW